jgi:hypothetical protein
MQEVFTSGITFLIDEVAKTLKENHWQVKEDPRREVGRIENKKKNYNAPEVKSAPEEKDKQKLYFSKKSGRPY